jgi:hypothetical protein
MYTIKVQVANVLAEVVRLELTRLFRDPLLSRQLPLGQLGLHFHGARGKNRTY